MASRSRNASTWTCMFTQADRQPENILSPVANRMDDRGIMTNLSNKNVTNNQQKITTNRTAQKARKVKEINHKSASNYIWCLRAVSGHHQQCVMKCWWTVRPRHSNHRCVGEQRRSALSQHGSLWQAAHWVQQLQQTQQVAEILTATGCIADATRRRAPSRTEIGVPLNAQFLRPT